MHERLVDLLVDPDTHQPLVLEAEEVAGGEVLAGLLRNPTGGEYVITNGIPRFGVAGDAGQAQTTESFAFKWSKRDTFDSADVLASFGEWLTTRYGFVGLHDMRRWFQEREVILDAGCGAGMSASVFLLQDWSGGEWIGVDISTAVDTARERLGSSPKIHLVQADLMRLPFADGTFDTIFSEGVLHHTPSTQRALAAVTRALRPGGEILFYVYLRKAPAREYMDDYVRDQLADLSPTDAWAALRSLTRFGQVLSDLRVQVDVPEDIPLLGIPAGQYDIQRLIYYHFAKIFWNDRYSFEENVHVNFDWYHPRYAHRQSPNEVRAWCEQLGLDVWHLHLDPSGITVRATKRD
jgi:arsenite methyltransferase